MSIARVRARVREQVIEPGFRSDRVRDLARSDRSDRVREYSSCIGNERECSDCMSPISRSDKRSLLIGNDVN